MNRNQAIAERQLAKCRAATPCAEWTAEDIEQATALWELEVARLTGRRLPRPAVERQPEPAPAPAPRPLLERRRNGSLWIVAR